MHTMVAYSVSAFLRRFLIFAPRAAFRAFLAAMVFSALAPAQTWQDTVANIEQLFVRYQPQNPGCQLSVSRNGEMLFSKAWGMADLEHSITMTAGTILEAGSVSKQFTAAAILLLEQQGKLSLDDDIRKYIPELPEYGHTIRLRHMMQHASGLKDWGAVVSLTGWPRSTKNYSNEDALKIISKQKSLNHKPGDEFLYSNSNYNLFAIVVLRVSGLTLAQFTKQNIFEPAGMTHTQWRDNPNTIVPNRGIAYGISDDGYEIEMPNESVYGNGGLLTTTEDLVKWNSYYWNGQLGSPSILPVQIAAGSFNNGQKNNYGAGLFIKKFRGQEYIEHGGATAGYRAFLEYFPQQRLSIAFLSNTSQFDTASVNTARMVKNIFIPPLPAELSKPVSSISVPVEKLMKLAGWYRNVRTGEGLSLTVKNNALTADNQSVLSATTESVFNGGTFDIQFISSSQLNYIPANRDTIRYVKTSAPVFSGATAKEYLGEYWSDETVSSVSIRRNIDTLIIQFKPGVEYSLRPTYKDGFAIKKFGGHLFFIRGRNNSVAGINISIQRARNVVFVKRSRQ